MLGCSTLRTTSPHGWPRTRIQIEDTETTFAIGWKGQYRIEGPTFIYADWDTGRTTTVIGYPTQKLIAMGQSRAIGTGQPVQCTSESAKGEAVS